MRFRTALILTLILVTLLPGLIASAQDDPQAFPPDVAAEIQAEMDDLTASGLPPGMVVVDRRAGVPVRGGKWFRRPHARHPDAAGRRVSDWQHHQDVHRDGDHPACRGRRAHPRRSVGASGCRTSPINCPMATRSRCATCSRTRPVCLTSSKMKLTGLISSLRRQIDEDTGVMTAGLRPTRPQRHARPLRLWARCLL